MTWQKQFYVLDLMTKSAHENFKTLIEGKIDYGKIKG